MAAQVIALAGPTGLATPTIRVFADGSDTQVSGSPFTVTEATNRKGYYSVSFTGTLAGMHLAVLYTGSSPIGSFWVKLANADGTYQCHGEYDAALLSLDTSGRVTLAAATHTGAVIPTVTNLTNLPTIPAGWITAGGITDGAFTAAKFAAASLNGKGDWSTYAGGDTSGTTTLLARLTSTRAGYIDNLSGGAVATAAALDAVDNFVDTEVAAIKAVTDKLDTALELDGSVYRYTTNALEQAPAGGGGGTTDWTADERTAIRTILGVPASGTTPDVPSAGALKVIDDLIDTEVAAIKSKTDLIPAGGFPGNFSAMTINAGGGVDLYSWAGTAVETQLGYPNVTLQFIPPGIINSAAFGTGAFGSAALNSTAADEIAAAVRDIDNTSPAANSVGARLNEVPTSSAIATAIWTYAITGTRTAAHILNRLAAAAYGKVTGSGTQYKDVGDGTTTVLTVADDGNGDRTVTQS